MSRQKAYLLKVTAVVHVIYAVNDVNGSSQVVQEAPSSSTLALSYFGPSAASSHKRLWDTAVRLWDADEPSSKRRLLQHLSDTFVEVKGSELPFFGHGGARKSLTHSTFGKLRQKCWQN